MTKALTAVPAPIICQDLRPGQVASIWPGLGAGPIAGGWAASWIQVVAERLLSYASEGALP